MDLVFEDPYRVGGGGGVQGLGTSFLGLLAGFRVGVSKVLRIG